MTRRLPAIKVLLLPKDTNAHGTIFGGVILSNIDLASAVEARKRRRSPLRDQGDARGGVPRAGLLGDIVSFYTELVRVGRTSMTVRVTVEAERWGVRRRRMGATGHGEVVKVTEAEVDAGGGQRPGPADPDPARTVADQPPATNRNA